MAYKITETRVLYAYKMASDRKGYLKIGDFFMDNDEYAKADEECLKCKAKDYVKSLTYSKDWDIEMLYAANATYVKDVTSRIGSNTYVDQKTFSVTAADVHEVLSNSNVEKRFFVRGEKDIWFKADLQTVILAIKAVKSQKKSLQSSLVDNRPPKIVFRPEQETAIQAAIDKFNTKTGKKYLWNAKMRFGKTLCALEVVRRQNYKATLIVTHRPDVDSNWYEDFYKIFYDNNHNKALIPYKYGSRSLETKDGDDFYALINEADSKHFVFFVSMQFLRLSTLVNDGEGADDNPLKKDIMQYDWDLVVVDEAHEGTRTSLGARVIDKLKKENTRMLSLSGTPFNLYDDFEQDEIYTWDYVSEQQAKIEWENTHYGDPNPYDVLPKMQIFVYQLKDLVTDIGIDEVDETFKFSEFFRVWTVDIKKDRVTMPSPQHEGKFIHENDVLRFLDKLVDADGDTQFPYSADAFKECFQHTLWIVPGVKEAKALENLLRKHDRFSEDNGIKVVNVAGEGSDEENQKALEAVNIAMRKYDFTITLSCGRLTTGVSVPNWTAVFYMKGSDNTTAATFMQTIFRSQTHAVFGEGKQKRYCYVFDFAPSRTLKVIAETAKMSVEVKMSDDLKKDKDDVRRIDNTSMADEEHAQMEAFLALCPIRSLDTGQMEYYDAGKLFSQLKKVYVERAVYSGFGDDSIYQMDELLKLDPDLLERMGKITGKMTKFKVGTITRGAKPLTKQDKEKIKDAHKQKREGKELTEEQKALLEQERKEREEKKNRASTLRALAIRIPLLMYGADLADGVDITLDNFTDDAIIDQASWNEFMPTGVTKEDFNILKAAIDPDIFKEAGVRYRNMAKKADEYDIEERIDYIATIFGLFHNPDKETVLTPWRVVNMHMSQTVGGWCFYNKKFDGYNTKEDENHNEIETIQPRWVDDNGDVTKEVFCDYNSRILEINSKTGLYPLYMAYSLFKCIKEPEFKKIGLTRERDNSHTQSLEYQTQMDNDLEIWKDVLRDNIFVVCRTQMAVNITKRTLAGFRDLAMNVKCYEREVSINDLVVAGVIKKNATGISKIGKTYYLDGKESKLCDIIDVLRAKPELFQEDVVRGRDFWNVYNSIPTKQNEDINNMKFNAIVGNPPYQLMGGSGGSNDSPIYQFFFDVAKNITGKYVSLIMPARWFSAGRDNLLHDFRNYMMTENHVVLLKTFVDSKQLFKTVDIKGGICYFLVNVQDKSKCHYVLVEKNKIVENDLFLGGNNVIIRNPKLAAIIKHVWEVCRKEKEDTKSISSLLSNDTPFGIPSNPRTSKKNPYDVSDIETTEYNLPLYSSYADKKRIVEYIRRIDVRKNAQDIDKIKVLVPGSAGTGQDSTVLGKPWLATSPSVCTQTFIYAAFSSKLEAENFISYYKTKFFRALVSAIKITQSAANDVYQFVPMLDFQESWNDEKLFLKFKIEDPDKNYINDLIEDWRE